MRTLTMRSMIAVAALAVTAASASAQSYRAEIPMPFRAGDKQMAPGSYDFQVVIGKSGHAHLVVYTAGGSATAVLIPFRGSDAPKAWQKEGQPKISFDCVGHTCLLARVWNGRDVSVYEFSGRKLPSAEVKRVAVVTVTLTRAD